MWSNFLEENIEVKADFMGSFEWSDELNWEKAKPCWINNDTEKEKST